MASEPGKSPIYSPTKSGRRGAHAGGTISGSKNLGLSGLSDGRPFARPGDGRLPLGNVQSPSPELKGYAINELRTAFVAMNRAQVLRVIDACKLSGTLIFDSNLIAGVAARSGGRRRRQCSVKAMIGRTDARRRRSLPTPRPDFGCPELAGQVRLAIWATGRLTSFSFCSTLAQGWQRPDPNRSACGKTASFP